MNNIHSPFHSQKRSVSLLFFSLLLLMTNNPLAIAQRQATSSIPVASEKYGVALEFPLKVGTTNEVFFGKGIAVDPSGNIYVTGSIAGVEKYSPAGVWIRSIGAGHRLPAAVNGIIHDPGGAMASPEGGRLCNPFGIALDTSGNIYVTDGLTECIQKFASDGSYLGACTIPDKDVGSGYPPNVVSVAIDGQNNLYVGDQTSNSVMKFDADGSPVAAYGSKGSKLGQFITVRFLAVDGEDLYAVDSLNWRVQVMKTDWTFVRSFGTRGNENGQLSQPDGIGVDGSHNIYVGDGNHVVKFAKDGTFLSYINAVFNAKENRPGNRKQSVLPLSGLVGIAVDRGGRVYVPDSSKRVVVFMRLP